MNTKRFYLVSAAVVLVAMTLGFLLTEGFQPAALAAVAPTVTATPTPALSGTGASQEVPGAPLSGDPAADKTLAAVNLQAGFILDPYLIPVVGHVDQAAASLQAGCNGFVGAEPNAVVNWSGSAERLNLFVYSDDDAVLVVQKPDGTILCNDDAGLNTVAPLVTIADPAAGAYKVYVGSAKKDAPALGFLALTQASLDDASLAALDLSSLLHRRTRPLAAALPSLNLNDLLLDRTAIFGSAELRADFKPVHTFAAGGGGITAFKVEDGKLACAGFLSPVPSYSFKWSGRSQDLRLYFEALKDSSLAVVTPNRQVLCGMDAAPGNLNPVVDVPNAVPGAYKVYVASMAPDTVVGGRMTITTDPKATPTPLAPAAR